MDVRRLHIAIFLLFLSTYAYFYNAGGGNQAARLNQTRAIVARGTLYNDGLGFPSDDHLYVNGHVYSNKAPGTSFLGVPSWALFHGGTVLLGLKSPFWQNWAVHMTTLFTVGIPAALMALVLYLFLVGVGLSPPRALIGPVAIGLGTNFLPYATMYFGHSLAAGFGFFAFYLLWRAGRLRLEGLPTGRLTLHAALLVGFAVITEYPAAIVAVALTLYLVLTRPTRREAGQWVAGGAVMAAVLALYNMACFGAPAALSYLNYPVSRHNSFPEMARGVGGVMAPSWFVLEEILVGEPRGLLRYAPVMVLVLPGLIYLGLRRRDLWREGLVVTLVVVGFLVFNAGYGDSIRYWGGANSAGPRHLIPMLPFAGVAIGLFAGFAPVSTVAVLLPSIAISLAVTAVMPQVPMLYARPLKSFIIPYFLGGRLALHHGGIVGRALVTEDSIAYNWGKLVGLPGSWAMLPLYLILALVLAYLFSRFYHDSQLSRRTFVAISATCALFFTVLTGAPVLYQHVQARPLSGPGVLGRYFVGRRCEGTPQVVARAPDLAFFYDREDIRPFPETFCAHWTTLIDIPDAGTYTFRLHSGDAKLEIDGEPVAFTGRLGRTGEATVTLTAGPHTLEIETVIGLVSNMFDVRWRRGGDAFVPVPAELLSAPEP